MYASYFSNNTSKRMQHRGDMFLLSDNYKARFFLFITVQTSFACKEILNFSSPTYVLISFIVLSCYRLACLNQQTTMIMQKLLSHYCIWVLLLPKKKITKESTNVYIWELFFWRNKNFQQGYLHEWVILLSSFFFLRSIFQEQLHFWILMLVLIYDHLWAHLFILTWSLKKTSIVDLNSVNTDFERLKTELGTRTENSGRY